MRVTYRGLEYTVVDASVRNNTITLSNSARHRVIIDPATEEIGITDGNRQYLEQSGITFTDPFLKDPLITTEQ